MRTALLATFAGGIVFLSMDTAALAQSSPQGTGFWADYIAGDWSLTLGGSVYAKPDYQGASNMALGVSPIISLSRSGTGPKFTSRNDNPGIALFDNGWLRMGPAGKIVFARDDSDSGDLYGLRSVPWGVELGGFADIYPTDWFRLRGELRQGIRAHHGLVFDLAGDAFYDITPAWRISGGPRLSAATNSFYRAYYGVSGEESIVSGLAPYSPGGGLRLVGVGGALTWKTTDSLYTSAFTEYGRLTGPAADSSLVRQRGSKNQWLIGVSAAYRFDFSL